MWISRGVAICIFGLLSILCTTGYAQEDAPLGNVNFALKLDYISFTHENFDSDPGGVYFGIEGYKRLNRNWRLQGKPLHLYLGGELGYAYNGDFLLGEDISFMPVELNLKMANQVVHNLIIDFGAGLSYCYTKVESHSLFSASETEDDWQFGGQIFADLTYNMAFLSIGCNAKYQITEDFKDGDVDLGNWRVGLQIGATF